VVAEADLVIIAAPHKEYRGLELNVPAVDLFNLLGKGVVV
jgi:UDP-N-acetyl-D-mannosaminuronic acid dehydrogenase